MKSVIGGVTTIVARLIVFAYFLVECSDVFNQEYTV
jgi:hypothetical protein